tara:strand:+ start:88 stop:390 length:303 start_codon:yes stop_codon:yes gene_type:complete
MKNHDEVIGEIVNGTDNLKQELILKSAPDVLRAGRILKSAEKALEGIKLVMDASVLIQEDDREIGIKLLRNSNSVLDVIGDMHKQYKRTMEKARQQTMFE